MLDGTLLLRLNLPVVDINLTYIYPQINRFGMGIYYIKMKSTGKSKCQDRSQPLGASVISDAQESGNFLL